MPAADLLSFPPACCLLDVATALLVLAAWAAALFLYALAPAAVVAAGMDVAADYYNDRHHLLFIHYLFANQPFVYY